MTHPKSGLGETIGKAISSTLVSVGRRRPVVISRLIRDGLTRFGVNDPDSAYAAIEQAIVRSVEEHISDADKMEKTIRDQEDKIRQLSAEVKFLRERGAAPGIELTEEQISSIRTWVNYGLTVEDVSVVLEIDVDVVKSIVARTNKVRVAAAPRRGRPKQAPSAPASRKGADRPKAG